LPTAFTRASCRERWFAVRSAEVAKYEVKTKPNEADVADFLASVEPAQRREDAQAVCELMQKVTRLPPRMWGTAMVGFGLFHYRSAAGAEGDWPLIGFAPRKQNLTVYLMDGFDEYGDLLSRLGKHSTSKSCLYIKRLSDVDQKVLKELVATSFRHMRDANR